MVQSMAQLDMADRLGRCNVRLGSVNGMSSVQRLSLPGYCCA